MRFSIALALASVPAAVLGATTTVTVGANNMLMFDPQNITAAAGDTVQFQFASKNHSVTQSTFTAPCTKAPTAINSGFLATPANSTASNGSMPTWSIQIQNASTPLWFYCAQKMPVVHCAMGMVFSINANAAKTFDAFQAAAKASGNSTASASGAAASGADASGAASSSASSASGTAGASPAAANSTSGSGTADAANAASSTTPSNGASTTAFKRGAAGLLTIAAVAAVLL